MKENNKKMNVKETITGNGKFDKDGHLIIPKKTQTLSKKKESKPKVEIPVLTIDDLKKEISDINTSDTVNKYGLHRVKNNDGLTLALVREAKYGLRFYLLNDNPASKLKIETQTDLKRASALIHAINSGVQKEGDSFSLKDGDFKTTNKNEMVLHFLKTIK